MSRTPGARITDIETTVDPTVTDDVDEALDVGSRWINETNGKIYFCVDNTLGAAVWKDVTLTAAAGSHPVQVSASDPTVTDDTNSGFSIGDHWINSTTQDIYQAVSVGVGAAVWVLLSGTGPLSCSDNLIAADLIVPSGKTCFAHNVTIADSIELTIQDTGELLLL